jgi:hypothetical protein
MIANATDINDLDNAIDQMFKARDRFIEKNENLSHLIQNDYKPYVFKATGESEFVFFGMSMDVDIMRSYVNWNSKVYRATSNVTEDVKTRDFTVNSIYYSYADKKIYDPLNGIDDLRNNTLRLVHQGEINPLLNNPFTIYRLIKMSVKYNMKLSDELSQMLNNETFKQNLTNILTQEQKNFRTQTTIENMFIAQYRKIFLHYNIQCGPCILKKMKDFDLFRYYIDEEFTNIYTLNREGYNNYILNIAIISEYFISEPHRYQMYKYVYSEIFETPFSEEKYLGSLRMRNRRYETTNKYLIAIPVAVNYCKKLDCSSSELTRINPNLLAKQFKHNTVTGTYYIESN